MNATSAPDLHPLLKRADRAAAGLSRRHQLPWFDADDARQELLLDLLCRLRHHDPSRGPVGNFIAICFHHRCQSLGAALHREQHQRHFTSLDDALPGREHLCVADTLTNEDGVGFWVGQDADPTEQAELSHDLGRALDSVGPESVPLCTALLVTGRGTATPQYSRTTLHRRVRDLRCSLLAAGIGPRETIRRRGGY